MRLNENTRILGEKVVLIPYMNKHVRKYHAWMESAELRELTASEELTLEEEYAMQKSWLVDENKLTFLILSRELFDQTNDEIIALIGDTNIFLSHNNDQIVAEAEIMIAEITARKKGCGREAMLLMLKYALEYIEIDKIVAKIGMNNEESLRLFQKLQFIEVARAEIFQEVTLERNVTQNWRQWLDEQINFRYEPYTDL